MITRYIIISISLFVFSCGILGTVHAVSFIRLGDLGRLISVSVAAAVSADGSVFVGHSSFAPGTEAFRGTAADAFFIDLGGLADEPSGISADGSVIISTTKGQNNNDEPFVWDVQNGS